MIIQHRFLLLIHILYCAAIIRGALLEANDAETCNLLCVQCNASAVFANDHCECIFADDSGKVSGAECVERVQREIQAIELNILSENPTEEERNVRSILKYRRRLRPGDAEKVAQYFINGGPAAGHSHFVSAFSAASDSDADSAANSLSGVIDESNPEGGFHGVLLNNRPVSWNTYDSPLYMVPEAAPYAGAIMQGAETYPTNPALTYPTNGLYDPMNPLGAIVHPYGHGPPLHHALIRAITLPGHILHHVLHPRTVHHPVHHGGIVRSTNFPQDRPGIAFVGQPCENNGDSAASDFPTARSDADKPAEQQVGAFGLADSSQNSAQYPYIAYNTNQPMQYQHVPYQYTSYYNPLMNVLHSVPNGYILQPVPHYAQSATGPLTAASNPYSHCGNNANIEQKSADKTVQSNSGIQRPNDATKNNIDVPKEEKKDGTDKS